MILLHDTAGNEIAVRVCDISRAERFKADADGPGDRGIPVGALVTTLFLAIAYLGFTLTVIAAFIVALAVLLRG